MKTKCIDDYIEEMEGFFPAIHKGSMRPMLNEITNKLTKYMAHDYRGFKVVSYYPNLAGETRTRFIVTRVFGQKHLNGLKKLKELKRIRNGNITK